MRLECSKWNPASERAVNDGFRNFRSMLNGVKYLHGAPLEVTGKTLRAAGAEEQGIPSTGSGTRDSGEVLAA